MLPTKTRLFLIVVASVILLTAIAFSLDRVIAYKQTTLLHQRIDQSKSELVKLVELANTSDKNYVVESSYWDELFNGAKNDTAWITENCYNSIVADTTKYKIDFFNIIDKDGNDIYQKVVRTKTNRQVLSFGDKKELVNSIKSKSTTIKRFIYNGVPLKAYIANITKSNDFEHKLPAEYYVITSQVMDERYLSGISNLNSLYNLRFGSPADTIDNVDTKNSKIEFSYQRDFVNAQPLNVRAAIFFPEVKMFKSFLRLAVFATFFLIALFIAALLWYYYKNYYLPLLKISAALHSNSLQPLSKISSRVKEVTEVSDLISDYFAKTKTLQDEIIQRKKSEEELKTVLVDIEKTTIEKLKAEQSLAAKSEFLSTMSHEIRTPINGVIGVANLLKDEALTERQKEYVDVLQYSANQLMALVTDILDFSKIDSGKIELESKPFDLNALCKSIFNLQKPLASEKHLLAVFEPEQQASNLYVQGDSVRLSQVLTNLLGNAIKFTEKGHVKFSYTCKKLETNNYRIKFSVEDTGIGIKDNERKNIFEGFSQANKNISKQFGGTGLGLSISKKLVELQGGQIHIDSVFGKGTTFTFELPFKVIEEVQVKSALKQQYQEEPIKGLRVLVAEDNNVNVLVIKRFLQKWGAVLEVASTGKEALDALAKNTFDVVLMDIHMPDMDGEEATRVIRTNKETTFNEIPIIALTANATTFTQQKLLENGFNSYVSKPFNPDALLRILQKYHYEKN
jgi:signal transduction histidine kinase/ActR/RegA family two-component response regulator